MKRVLIACEYSGVVRDAFRQLGHDAWSCDIVPTDSDPTYHYQTDVIELLNKTLSTWDMLIAFPPCDHLSKVGARYWPEKRADGRQQAAVDFFWQLAWADIPHVAIENPIGIMSRLWRKPDQIIEPWMFGDPFDKKTCLWLRGLPLLTPTNIVDSWGPWVDGGTGFEWAMQTSAPKTWNNKTRAKIRARTFEGIADAMAEQWGCLL